MCVALRKEQRRLRGEGGREEVRQLQVAWIGRTWPLGNVAGQTGVGRREGGEAPRTAAKSALGVGPHLRQHVAPGV